MKHTQVVYLLTYYIILKYNFSESPAFNLINIPRLFPMDLPRTSGKNAPSRQCGSALSGDYATSPLYWRAEELHAHPPSTHAAAAPALMRRKFWESDGVEWAAGVCVRADRGAAL